MSDLSLRKKDLTTIFRWALLVTILVGGFFNVHNGALSLLLYSLPVIFVFLHGGKYLGWRGISVFFVLIFVVTFVTEFLGVHTGKIFGDYFYNSQNNGPMIAGVPPLVMLTYFSLGYSVYLVIRVLLGELGVIKGGKIAAVAVLGGMLMTLCDLASDPVNSTINQVYIWVNGGAFFGVPYLNFVGWFFETAIFFGVLGLIYGYWLKTPIATKKLSKWFLFEALVLFLAPILPIIFRPLWQTTNVDIYQAMSLIALFGIGTITLITGFRLFFSKKTV